ncbi:MAG TPA: OmpA family protein [Bacteroidia bacterium]|nr:OmpA family protein [Bacteroidia bacterium]
MSYCARHRALSFFNFSLTKKLFLSLFFLFCAFSYSNAQEETLSTKNKKAIQNYYEGQKFYDGRMNSDAEQAFLKAIKEDGNFVEAHMMLGYVYSDEGKVEDAIKQIQTALELNPNFVPTGYFTLARLEILTMKYADALKNLQTFKTFPADYKRVKWLTDLDISSCIFSIDAMQHPVPFNPKNMGAAINSEFDEYEPAITADGETFLFTRRLVDPNGTEGYNEDFFVSKKSNGEWTKAYNLGRPLNTRLNEGAPTLSADGNVLIFTGCDRPGAYGSCDLYYSLKNGDSWTQARTLGPPIDTRNWETQPSLSSDGKTLYFIRGIETSDGIKGQDIYMTQLSDSGYWNTPVKLSDTINTPGKEESVFIAADNQTLYFCSDGHPGLGGLDIFVSRKLPNGRWGIPKNLGYPINTSGDETGIMVDPNGQLAYFASDRAGGLGGLDFYEFPLYDSARPQPVTYMKGKVFDAVTKKPLVASFNLIDLSNGQQIMQSTSGDDGTFMVCLPLNKNYALNVSRKGYLFYSENFSLQNVANTVVQPYLMNVPLQPIDTGASIVLKNIFFETNKFDLKPESQIELNKLVAFLNNNPTVQIEVSGHTDNVGTPQSNIILSKNRAKSVYDYLVAHSIAPQRLTYKGYGQTRPIASNDNEEGRAKNRRTEMKIIAK